MQLCVAILWIIQVLCLPIKCFSDVYPFIDIALIKKIIPVWCTWHSVFHCKHIVCKCDEYLWCWWRGTNSSVILFVLEKRKRKITLKSLFTVNKLTFHEYKDSSFRKLSIVQQDICFHKQMLVECWLHLSCCCLTNLNALHLVLRRVSHLSIVSSQSN